MLKKVQKFNAKLALIITNVVGSMWCAYLFTCLALISLPQAITGGTATLVAWTAQTFLQLVLLSIIMVGQDVKSIKSEKRAEEDHITIQAEFDALKHIHEDIRTDIAVNAELLQLLREDVAANRTVIDRLEHLDTELDGLHD
jgi:hypothetical protein